ncbi:hypothetical protein BaRGS_00029994 [Batillaria attramentaria]|uniref:Uncharacterized protein n=1 Tax=Batillaria attramentaria TaxID=370345 RepID=A0ABD0JW29_9CAEN
MMPRANLLPVGISGHQSDVLPTAYLFRSRLVKCVGLTGILPLLTSSSHATSLKHKTGKSGKLMLSTPQTICANQQLQYKHGSQRRQGK